MHNTSAPTNVVKQLKSTWLYVDTLCVEMLFGHPFDNRVEAATCKYPHDDWTRNMAFESDSRFSTEAFFERLLVYNRQFWNTQFVFVSNRLLWQNIFHWVAHTMQVIYEMFTAFLNNSNRCIWYKNKSYYSQSEFVYLAEREREHLSQFWYSIQMWNYWFSNHSHVHVPSEMMHLWIG